MPPSVQLLTANNLKLMVVEFKMLTLNFALKRHKKVISYLLHSYRRTKNLRAVQLLLGHTKLESTVRYLGIEVVDALEMAEQTEV
jgi:site-specific recombinase XerC